MTFFYDLNKKLSDLAAKQTLNEGTSHQAKTTMKHVDASDASPRVKAELKKASGDIKPGTAGYDDRARMLKAAGVKDTRGPRTDEGSTGDYSAKKASAGKDIGKPGKNFAKIAKGAAGRYGSKAAGERVAGAVLNKLRHPKESAEMDESAFQAAIGKKKYGDEGMKALQKAGREHAGKEKMASIRDKYDKYDESMGMTDEGNAFSGAVAKAKANGVQPGEKINVGGKTYPVKESLGGMEQILQQHASDVAKFKQTGELSDNLYGVLFDYYSDNGEMPYGTQKARTGDPYEWITKHLDRELSMSEGVATEAAKWRDPKFKDKLYTQEPRDYDQYDYGDDDYYNPKPANYPGEKNLKGGSEFSHNDPLQKGQGIGRSGIKHNILDRGPRKGMPSRNQITSLKGSIKDAHGTHARPNLPEAGGAVDFDKVLDAIAALYGDDMWENDAMQDLANDLAQAGPTDRELDFIIAKGRLPKRLANTQFSAGDNVQFGEAGTSMTAKQKSFAKLAPPADKITFADKIAGAKKEVDEMLGDVAAEAMKQALGRGKKVVADEAEDNSPFTAHKRPRVERPKIGSVERGALHDIEHTATGRRVTRRVDPNTGHSVGSDDDAPASGEKRGRGRPAGKGAGKSIGAKGPSGKSKLMKREGADDIEDQGEYDQEGDMALDDINTIKSAANELQSIIDANENLPEWVQSKINKAMDYLDTARDYMSAQEDDDEMAMGEEKTTKRDNRAERAGKKVTKDIEYDEKKKDGIHGKKRGAEDDKAERAGKKVTKDIEYDEKKSKKKEVDETTTAGSVATAPATGKTKAGSMFGKGVYESAIAESFKKKLGTVLTEGISINMNVGEDGTKSLSVNATDEDAEQLAQLLKMAGLGGGEESCSSCGQSSCGCDPVAEDLANSPSPEYSDTNTMVNTLSGGLNGRKSSGQTTIPVVNRDPRRGSVGPMAEGTEARLWAIYNRYSTK